MMALPPAEPSISTRAPFRSNTMVGAMELRGRRARHLRHAPTGQAPTHLWLRGMQESKVFDCFATDLGEQVIGRLARQIPAASGGSGEVTAGL